MRIAIDARALQEGFGGRGRHVLNLLLGLSQRESDLEFIVFYRDVVARRLLERSGGPFRGRFQWVKANSELGSAFENIEIPWLLRMHKADLFHDVASTGVWTGRVPSVVTMHELSGISFGDAKKTRQHARRVVKNSRLVIAVSGALADEIEQELNLSRPKIRIIHNAIDPSYNERVGEKEIRAMRERFHLKADYFLCVTTDKPHKNIQLVRDVAADWSGETDWVFTLTSAVADHPARIHYPGVVEDTWLRPLYAASTAVIVPSLYEGFSLPPIEALALGALPVVSNIAPHREIIGDVLPNDLIFDPLEKSSLVRALQRIQEGGEPLKQSILERFRSLRERYSYLETADAIQSVYREAIRK